MRGISQRGIAHAAGLCIGVDRRLDGMTEVGLARWRGYKGPSMFALSLPGPVPIAVGAGSGVLVMPDAPSATRTEETPGIFPGTFRRVSRDFAVI